MDSVPHTYLVRPEGTTTVCVAALKSMMWPCDTTKAAPEVYGRPGVSTMTLGTSAMVGAAKDGAYMPLKLDALGKWSQT